MWNACDTWSIMITSQEHDGAIHTCTFCCVCKRNCIHMLDHVGYLFPHADQWATLPAESYMQYTSTIWTSSWAVVNDDLDMPSLFRFKSFLQLMKWENDPISHDRFGDALCIWQSRFAVMEILNTVNIGLIPTTKENWANWSVGKVLWVGPREISEPKMWGYYPAIAFHRCILVCLSLWLCQTFSPKYLLYHFFTRMHLRSCLHRASSCPCMPLLDHMLSCP